MKKLLILDNNKDKEQGSNRITLRAVYDKLNNGAIQLTEIKAKDTDGSEYFGDPSNDIIYCGRRIEDKVEWRVCLRTVYVPPEFGKDYFSKKLDKIVEGFKPQCILSHMALYGRGNMFYEYPAVNNLMKYADDMRVVIYTGTADDQESIIADTQGLIEYRYNKRNIDSQIDIILDLLKNSD